MTIFAAASLTDAFKAMQGPFQARYPGISIQFNFAASSSLATQITAGAPADVFASADTDSLDAAGGSIGEKRVFAHNLMTIAVERGNHKGIRGIGDLARSDLIVVLCDPTVPCGKYAGQILSKAGVTVHPKSLEPNVRGVLSRVALGSADAGITYVTDVLSSNNVSSVPIPSDLNALATYPIGIVQQSRNPAVARAFMDFVTSPEGQAILARYGFLPA